MARADKVGEGFGGGGAGMARAISKVVNKAGEKGATKAGFKAAKKTAETTKAPKYPSASGKKVSTKVQGKVSTTSKSGRTTSKSAEKVEYTKKPPTEAQRLGSFKAQNTNRTKKIVESGANTKAASQKIIGKEVIKKNAYKLAAIGWATKDQVLDKKKGKK